MADLTTTANVKERLGITIAAHDSVIGTLVTEVSEYMQDRMGRIIDEDTYTEYYDGTGTEWLFLRQGPLVSVTSVNSVSYSGTTSRTETLTAVNEGDRLEGGLKSENWTQRGFLRMLGGSPWVTGRRNYKVVYVAGWSTVPSGLAHAATNLIAAKFNARQAEGLTVKALSDGSIDPISIEEAQEQMESAIAPYVFVTDGLV